MNDATSPGKTYFAGRRRERGSPGSAIAAGIALVPEDRKRQGLVLAASALHNVSLPSLWRLARATWVQRARERKMASEYFDRLRVPAIDVVVGGLSGGNQQKVVLAKWLAMRSTVLILDEPTRGVDVGAKAEIHALIGELAAQGTAILLISSELEEVLTLAERILVLREGRLVGEVRRDAATQEGLLRLMTGLSATDPAPVHRGELRGHAGSLPLDH